MKKASELKQQNILRELNKAILGFTLHMNENPNTVIATGKWGCGAFGGDP